MRASCVTLLLLLSLALMSFSETEGRGFLGKIKNAVQKAGRWVKNNCSLGLGGVSCKGIRFGRKKRSTDDTPGRPIQSNLDKECPEFDVGADAKLFDVTDVAFQEMDDNKDGSLDTEESVRFTEVLGVLDYCSDLKGKKAVN